MLSCICQRITILWETFEETFKNFEVLLLHVFAKVFSAKFGGVTFFDSTCKKSGKFSPWNLILQQFAKVFCHESFPLYDMVFKKGRIYMSWTSRIPVLGRSYKSQYCSSCLHDKLYLAFLSVFYYISDQKLHMWPIFACSSCACVCAHCSCPWVQIDVYRVYNDSSMFHIGSNVPTLK